MSRWEPMQERGQLERGFMGWSTIEGTRVKVINPLAVVAFSFKDMAIASNGCSVSMVSNGMELVWTGFQSFRFRDMNNLKVALLDTSTYVSEMTMIGTTYYSEIAKFARYQASCRVVVEEEKEKYEVEQQDLGMNWYSIRHNHTLVGPTGRQIESRINAWQEKDTEGLLTADEAALLYAAHIQQRLIYANGGSMAIAV